VVHFGAPLHDHVDPMRGCLRAILLGMCGAVKDWTTIQDAMNANIRKLNSRFPRGVWSASEQIAKADQHESDAATLRADCAEDA
jgi:phosphoribosyl-dephospho-CoA transferase